MVPGAFAGEMRQAFISRLPADTTTGMPAARSSRTAESSAGTDVEVSAMNDQLATARVIGEHPLRAAHDGVDRSAHAAALHHLHVDQLHVGRDAERGAGDRAGDGR